MNSKKSHRKSFSLTKYLAISLGLAVATLATLALPHSASAQEVWVGNTDANLATDSNWADSTAPVSTQSWTFNAAGTAGTALINNLTLSTAFQVAGITFSSTSSSYVIDAAHAGTFTLTGNIASAQSTGTVQIGSNIAISGSRQVNLTGGAGTDLTLSGNLTGNGTLTQGASGSTKALILSGDNSGFTGSFVQNNDTPNRTAFNAASAGSASAAWTLNRTIGGGISLNNIGGNTISFGSLAGTGFIRSGTTGISTISVGALGTNATFTGQIQDNGNNNIAVVKTGAGTWTLGGTGGSTYDAGTTVSQGTLLANNTVNATGAGIVTVQSGATLGGTGVIDPTGAAAVSISGTLAPGDSLAAAGATTGNLSIGGTLNLNGGYVVELGGTGIGDGAGNYDQTNQTEVGVNGAVTLGGTATLTASLINGFAPAPSDVFYILNSNNSRTGTFSGIAEGGSISLGGGFTGQVTYAANYDFTTPANSTLTGGNDVAIFNVVAVPEPSTFAMLLGGFGMLLGFQRARRRSI